MTIEPWLPAITAALTLANTIVLVWSARTTRSIKRHVNGMQLQMLAEAERRGRRSAERGPRSVSLRE